MRIPRYAAYAALLTVLVACAPLGLITPKSFSERLAYGYSQTTALRNVAANALNSGSMASEDGQYVLEVTDRTRTLLDAAKVTAEAGDPSTAEGRLTLAIGVLQQLSAYLERGVR